MMQEEQLNDNDHLLETVSYIAWEPASGALGDSAVYEVNRIDELTDIWQTYTFTEAYATAPLFLADMQTTTDADPANLRYQLLNAGQIQLRITEEQSTDANIDHFAETVGMIIIGEADNSLPGDYDKDNDVDGSNIADFINGLIDMPLSDFADQFGNSGQ
jgi:hypothetical protein